MTLLLRISTLILSVVSVIAVPASIADQAKDSFDHSCRNAKALAEGGSVQLAAICRDSTGAEAETALDLNACFVNADGELRRASNGGFAHSCVKCLELDSVLTCYCYNNDNQPHETSVLLYQYITNQEGVLCCGSDCGFKSS